MDINKIARLSADSKKPAKTDAFNQLKRVIELSGDSAALELADLYAFFTPTISKPKTLFQWAVKAHGIKDVRHYINFVYSDGKRLLSTDGHRAHIVDDVISPIGFYSNNGALVHDNDYGEFPNIDKIMPDINDMRPINLSDMELIDIDSHAKATQAYKLTKDIGFNAKYLREALSFGDMKIFITRNKFDNLRDCKMLLISEDRTAIIMPVRL